MDDQLKPDEGIESAKEKQCAEKRFLYFAHSVPGQSTDDLARDSRIP